jgi:hypothetical protein
VAALGKERGVPFVLTTLSYGQVLWRQGFPAQALLQINRAFSADVRGTEQALARWFPPYAAIAWILRHRPGGQFLGNPRRHYQHLATRMVEPRRDLRTWRAWACWAIARRILPADEFPADLDQINREGIREPEEIDVRASLARLGLPGEVENWNRVLAMAVPATDGLTPA